MKSLSLLIVLASGLLIGCPAITHLRTNGVYSVGPEEPAHELYLIAQVYYQTPPPGFHPAEFKWSMKNVFQGQATLTVFDETNFDHSLLTYDFNFSVSDLMIQKRDQKMTYQGHLVSRQDASIAIDVLVEEYEVSMTEKTKTFDFDRRDLSLILYQNSEILGRYKGATMSLKSLKGK